MQPTASALSKKLSVAFQFYTKSPNKFYVCFESTDYIYPHSKLHNAL